MKPPLSDTLVICDMDNTLLTAKEGIPACNRAVIQLYTGMGGFHGGNGAARRSPSARRWGTSACRCRPSPATGRCCMISLPSRCCTARAEPRAGDDGHP